MYRDMARACIDGAHLDHRQRALNLAKGAHERRTRRWNAAQRCAALLGPRSDLGIQSTMIHSAITETILYNLPSLNGKLAGGQLKLIPVLVVFLSTASAHAAPIKVNFSGTVSRIWYADCLDQSAGVGCSTWKNTNVDAQDTFTGSSIKLGDRFTGGFVYDSSAPYVVSDDGFQAVHLSSVPLFHLSIGDFSLPSALTPMVNGSYSTVNGRYDRDSFYATANYLLAELFASVDFHLTDSSGQRFNDFRAPESLTLGDFSNRSFNFAMLRLTDGDQVHYNGSVDSLSTQVIEVAEPSSGALFAGGLILAGWVRRRRRSCQSLSRPSI